MMRKLGRSLEKFHSHQTVAKSTEDMNSQICLQSFQTSNFFFMFRREHIEQADISQLLIFIISVKDFLAEDELHSLFSVH